MAAVFGGEFGNSLAATEAEPIVPGFANAIPRSEISLIELIALDDLRQDAFDGKVSGIQDRVSGADSRGMMRVTGCGHRQTADLRVFESVAVVASEGGRGVENFDRIDRQFFESRETDSGAEEIVRMRRNGEATAFMDGVADFKGGSAFQIRQRSANAEEVAIGGGGT